MHFLSLLLFFWSFCSHMYTLLLQFPSQILISSHMLELRVPVLSLGFGMLQYSF